MGRLIYTVIGSHDGYLADEFGGAGKSYHPAPAAPGTPSTAATSR